MNRFLIGNTIWLTIILIFTLFSASGARAQRVIALTFDDGPKVSVLKELLPLLDSYNIKATFFVNGYRFQTNRMAAYYIAALSLKGHSIQNHTFYHKNFRMVNKKYGRQWILDDINRNSELIEKYAKKKPIFLRPPYEVIWPELKKDIEILGYNVVDSDTDIDSADYRLVFNKQGRNKMISNILRIIKNRENKQKFYHIILFHELKGTVKALPELIESLRMQGYDFDVLENVYPYLK